MDELEKREKIERNKKLFKYKMELFTACTSIEEIIAECGLEHLFLTDSDTAPELHPYQKSMLNLERPYNQILKLARESQCEMFEVVGSFAPGEFDFADLFGEK